MGARDSWNKIMEQLAQIFVDILAWFLLPFATVLGVTWVVSLFRR